MSVAVATISNPLSFLSNRSKWWWACLVVAFCCVGLLVGTLMVYAASTCSFTSLQTVVGSGGGHLYAVVDGSGVHDYDVVAIDTPSISTSAATNVEMVGYPHATLNGVVTDMGNVEAANVYWQWGYDIGYGYTTGLQAITAIGNYATEFIGFNPDKEVHYRFAVTVCDDYVYGSDSTFQLSETPDYWKISSLIPLAFLFGIIFVIIKAFTNAGGGVALIIAILGALIFFLVAMQFVPTIFSGLESMWGGG